MWITSFSLHQFRGIVSTTEKTTAADYESLVGNYILTYTSKESATENNVYTLNMIVTETSKADTYNVELVGMSYDDNTGVTTTTREEVKNEVPDYTTSGRSLTVTGTTVVSGDITLTEINGKLAITVEGYNKEKDDTDAQGDEGPMYDNGTVYEYSAEAVAGGKTQATLATTTLSFNEKHTAHAWDVMEWKGVKTFAPVSDKARGAATVEGAYHYLSCDCGIAYLEEGCNSDASKKTTAYPTATTACAVCGFTLKEDSYLKAEITSKAQYDADAEAESSAPGSATHAGALFILLPAKSSIDLSGTKLSLFNRAEIEVSGWSLTDALWESGSVVLQKDKAVLVYTEKPEET